MGPNPEDGEGPGHFSVQGREEDHWEETVAKKIRELGIPTAGGDKERSGNGGDTEIHHTEAEYGRAIYYDAANSVPIRAGHPVARSTGVSEAVGLVRDRPGGSVKTGGSIIDDEIGDGFRGGFGRGSKRDCGRRRGGVSGSEQVQWSGVEWGGGQLRMNLDLQGARNTAGRKVAILKLKGTESSAIIAAVMGWSSTTHY